VVRDRVSSVIHHTVPAADVVILKLGMVCSLLKL